ncbi:MAG: aspartate carbamoyltransferase catalytic subunit [Cyanobacteria bacterium]|nr:aspartate carbamoyltransferase catalytic subunit [Cyanobacteriota bacterium]MDA1020668.1 aspartate carbamoyltransferase catalytic subunit [Cyanobacteriota bacterium]
MAIQTKMRKDLILLKEFSTEEINSILDRGDFWAENPNSQISSAPRTVANPVVVNLFFEPSTRTRFSFELAAKKLGYHVLNFDAKNASTEKGETLYDTLRTFEAMGVNTAIIRTREEGILQEIAPLVNVSLINAGAGANEHPTQGLLDLLTIRQEFGRIEGLKVAIVGDIKHSRVANSNIVALSKFGADISIAGPEQWMPSELETNVEIKSVDDAMIDADVVMMLRVQSERHALTNTIDNYLESYGLNKTRFAKLKDTAIIMHPAPFNRGIEIDGDLIEQANSRIYKQVANGVAIRMAVLELCNAG